MKSKEVGMRGSKTIVTYAKWTKSRISEIGQEMYRGMSFGKRNSIIYLLEYFFWEHDWFGF